MADEQHRVPGEALGERLSSRSGNTRHVGTSSAFYARFGLTNPMLPEGPVGGQDRSFGLVYLSSAAFYDHMARRTAARERRIARHEAVLGRTRRRSMSAMRRATPTAVRGLRWSGLGLLGESDFTIAEPDVAQPVVDESEAATESIWGPRHSGANARPVSSPWLSFETTPARVFRGDDRPRDAAATGPSRAAKPSAASSQTPSRSQSRSELATSRSSAAARTNRAATTARASAESSRRATASMRPGVDPRVGGTSRTVRRATALDRAARRIHAIDTQPLAAVVSDVSRRRMPTAARSLAAPRAAAAAEEHVAVRRAVRAARRALGPAARAVGPRIEAGLDDALASPLTRAASRLPAAKERPRGLQRRMMGSPSLSVVASAVAPLTDEVTRAPIARSPVRRAGPSAPRSTTRTAATRGGSRSATTLARSARIAGPGISVPTPAPTPQPTSAPKAARRVAPTARAMERGAALRTPAAPARQAAFVPVRDAQDRMVAGRTPSANRRARVARRASTRPSTPSLLQPGFGSSAGPAPASIDSMLPGPRPSAASTTRAAATRPSASRTAPTASRSEAVRAPVHARDVGSAHALKRLSGASPSRGARMLSASPVATTALQPDAASAGAGPTAAARGWMGRPTRRPSVGGTVHAAERVLAATADAGSLVPRPIPGAASRPESSVDESSSWLEATADRSAAPAFRRLGVARSAQGIYAPASVVAQPDAAPESAVVDGETATAPRRGRTQSAPVVSGWARKATPPAEIRLARAASPAAHAQKRLARASAPAPARVGARPSVGPRAASPTRAVAPSAAGRLSRRSGSRKSRSFSPGVVALEPGLVPSTPAAHTTADLPTRANARSVASPVVGRTARAAQAHSGRRSQVDRAHGRPNPMAHAGPAVVAETVRLSHQAARSVGLSRLGRRERGSASRWLVSGDATQRVLAMSRTEREQASVAATDEVVGSATASVRGAAAARAQSGGAASLASDRGDLRRSRAAKPDTSGVLAVVGDEPSAAETTTGTGRSTAGRPLDWAADRDIAVELAEVRQGLRPSVTARLAAPSPTAARPGVAPGARAGRYLVRTPEGRYVPAPSTRRPVGAGAAVAGMVVPTPYSAAPEADAAVSATTGAPVVSGWARAQAPLGQTLTAVGNHDDDTHMPVWARRASGTPLVRSSEGDLISALARADAPEDIVRVILEKGPSALSSLPTPALQVIEKIRSVARDEVADAIRSEVSQRASSARKANRRGESPRSTARVVRGFTGLRTSASARRSGGVGDDQVMKLAKKLQSLIHLAEGRRAQGDARRQVRMAEDSAAARGEGSAAPGTTEGGQDSSIDIDSLIRQVVAASTGELDLRRERRQEDSDERGGWW
jgi:hypothetical protein